MAADIIEILKENSNKLLKNEAAGIEAFKNLQHTAADLAKLLKHTIVDITIQNGRRYICTANEQLVKKFSVAKPIGNVLEKTKQKAFESKEDNKTLAWDLLKNKYITIMGNRWQIHNFIMVVEENIDILHSTIVDLLRTSSRNLK